MILRTGKVLKRIGDDNGRWCYAKLSYNSRYPWESDLSSGLSAASYVLKESDIGKTEQMNSILWSGERGGVLYRRALFGFDSSTEWHWTSMIDLADFPVSNGLVRADKLRLFHKPVDVYLGSYGFPCPDATYHVEKRENAEAVILKGCGSDGKTRHMAMTVYSGWGDLSVQKSTCTNPDTKESFVIFAHALREKVFAYEPYILISQVITKEGDEGFSEDEIFSIAEIKYKDKEQCGGYGPVEIKLKSGDEKVVDFSLIEGRLSL